MGWIVFDSHGNFRRARKQELERFMHWNISGRSLEPIVVQLEGRDLWCPKLQSASIIQYLRNPEMAPPKEYYEATNPPGIYLNDPSTEPTLPFTNWNGEARTREFMAGMRALDKYLHAPRERFIQARIEFCLFLYQLAQKQERLPGMSVCFQIPYVFRELIHELDSSLDIDQLPILDYEVNNAQSTLVEKSHNEDPQDGDPEDDDPEDDYSKDDDSKDDDLKDEDLKDDDSKDDDSKDDDSKDDDSKDDDSEE